MPTVSVIVPVIIAGLTVGSVIKSNSKKISNKKLMSASVAAGLLNGLYGYAVDMLSPRPTFARGATSVAPTFASSFQTTSSIVFVAESVLAGFLIVLAVLGIAKVYARRGKGEEEGEELSKLTSEEESALTSG
jgi:hypothetical protein